MMSFLRVQLLGVQAQEPWRYYVAFQMLGSSSTSASALSAAAQKVASKPSAAGLPPDEVCRTDTARPSRAPEFSSRTFWLRLPTATQTSGHVDADRPSGQPLCKLYVSLFAAPSLEAPAGPIIAGREADRLVGSATLNLEQQLLQRLAVGEQVAVPVLLQEALESKLQQMPEGLGSQAARLQMQRSSQQPGLGVGKMHVLLELMLLHVGSTAPVAAGVGMHRQQGEPAASTDDMDDSDADDDSGDDDSELTDTYLAASAAADGAGGKCNVQLLVFVSAASNVPLVPGISGQLEPPQTQVVLQLTSTGAQHSGGQTQAITQAVGPSTEPAWSQLLCLSCTESQLSHSLLQIALVSKPTNRALAKSSLKLSGLLPGQHYSLALCMTATCTLYMTVVLVGGQGTLLEALQGSGLTRAAASTANRLQLLQFKVPRLSLVASELHEIEQGWDVFAVWRNNSSPGSDAAKQQSRQQHVYTLLDGQEGSEAASAAMLRVYNSNNSLLAVSSSRRSSSASSKKEQAPGADSLRSGLTGIMACVPIASSHKQQATVVWPQPHQVTIPVLLDAQTTLTLELHLQQYPTASNKQTKHSSGSSSGGSNTDRLPTSVVLARATIPLAAVAKHAAESVCQLGGLQFSRNPQGALTQGQLQASIDVIRWECSRYLAHLQQLSSKLQVGPHQLQQNGPRALQNHYAHSPKPGSSHWQGAAQVQVDRQGHKAIAAAAAGVSASAAARHDEITELLLSDVVGKQHALERLQRQLDLAGQCSEAADGRIAELQTVNSNLAADLQHLRHLLHEEKEAAATAQNLLDSSQPHLLPGTNVPLTSASREQVLQQLTVLLGKHAKERARNGELVRRLQQLHAEKVEVMELQRQYLELQDAHFQQSKLLVDQEMHQSTVATLKKAVTDQEALINRLQQMLAAAAARSKELEVWKATADALQQEVHKLREELEKLSAAAEAAEKAAAAQATTAALAESQALAAQAASQFETELMAREADRLAALMRAEKAETSAVAAQNELLDVTKRYAREVAQLKTKLAEKDAQLLGGFGSLDHLSLGLNGSSAAQGEPLASLCSPGDLCDSIQWLSQMPTHGLFGLPPALKQQATAQSSNQEAPSNTTPLLPYMYGVGSNSQKQHLLAGLGAEPGAELAAGMRAGSAEVKMVQRQGTSPSQRTSKLDNPSKPGSPLLPTVVQQQRLTLSAGRSGVRSPGSNTAAATHSNPSSRVPSGSSMQRVQQQQPQPGQAGSTDNQAAPSPRQLVTSNSPRQQNPRATERLQLIQGSQPQGGWQTANQDEEEGETDVDEAASSDYVDDENEDDDEPGSQQGQGGRGGLPPAVPVQGPGRKQGQGVPAVADSKQPPGSPSRRRGGLAGLFGWS